MLGLPVVGICVQYHPNVTKVMYDHYAAIPLGENNYGTGITWQRDHYSCDQKSNPRGPRGGLKQRLIKALWNPLRNRKEVAVARFGRKPTFGFRKPKLKEFDQSLGSGLR